MKRFSVLSSLVPIVLVAFVGVATLAVAIPNTQSTPPPDPVAELIHSLSPVSIDPAPVWIAPVDADIQPSREAVNNAASDESSRQ